MKFFVLVIIFCFMASVILFSEMCSFLLLPFVFLCEGHFECLMFGRVVNTGRRVITHTKQTTSWWFKSICATITLTACFVGVSVTYCFLGTCGQTLLRVELAKNKLVSEISHVGEGVYVPLHFTLLRPGGNNSGYMNWLNILEVF